MDMDLKQAAQILSCSMDLFMQHGSGQWTCMDAGMPDADKKLSPALLVFH
jgi:hypothetical protein